MRIAELTTTWGFGMRRVSFVIAGIAALAAASPASAVTVMLNMTTTGNQPLNGTAGNTRTFTVTQGAASVTAKVSAFAISTTNSVNTATNTINNNGDNKCGIGTATFSTANCITKSYLGDFGAGLGVTSSADSNGDNNFHTIDNVGQQDFIIIQFDRKVKLVSATFSPYTVSNSTDTDATIGVRNLAVQSDLGQNAAINLTSRNTLSALVGTRYESSSTSTSINTRALDASGYVGRIWMIAASLQVSNQRYYDNKKDGFKLSNVKVETVGAIPEPASWAMMIAGFGFAGAAIRRQKAALRLA